MVSSVVLTGRSAPLIGITGSWVQGPSGSATTACLQRPYIEAVREAGGAVVILPPFIDRSTLLAGSGGTQISSASLERILSALDGILFSGGEDICPTEFGQEPHPKLGRVCKERDFAELYLARAAHQRGVPTLGICRGAQLLNVALGGTLIQDLPDQRGVEHSLGSSSDYSSLEIVRHTIKIEAGSRLSAILGGDGAGEQQIGVNSSHHQAVDRLGERLRVVGQSEDGTVEAIEDSTHRFFIGVQGHPERMYGATEPRWAGLFRTFVAICSKRYGRPMVSLGLMVSMAAEETLYFVRLCVECL